MEGKIVKKAKKRRKIILIFIFRARFARICLLILTTCFVQQHCDTNQRSISQTRFKLPSIRQGNNQTNNFVQQFVYNNSENPMIKNKASKDKPGLFSYHKVSHCYQVVSDKQIKRSENVHGIIVYIFQCFLHSIRVCFSKKNRTLSKILLQLLKIWLLL
jgi:hypothetical protein